jgi:hypothetical protein
MFHALKKELASKEEPLPPTRQEKKVDESLCDGIHRLEALQHFHESKETRLEVAQQKHTSIAKKVAEEAAAAAAKQAEKERLRLVAEMEKAQ